MKYYDEKRMEFSSDELEKITGYKLLNNFGVYSFEKENKKTTEKEDGYIEISNEVRISLINYINRWFIQPPLPEDTTFHTWIWAFSPSVNPDNETRAVIAWKTTQTEII